MCTPQSFYQHLFLLHHPLTQPNFTQPLLSNPCCSPYTIPRGTTPRTHQTWHTPNPFHPSPLLLPLPSTIIHAPIWCSGRSPIIGPRAACSLNGMPLGSYSVHAKTGSGLSSTRPLGDRCGTDQSSRLICRPMLALRPMMLSNAPRTRGQLGWHAQPLSVSTLLDSKGEAKRLAPCYFGPQHRHTPSVPARHH